MFTIGLPKWAMESTDPYVMRLVEGSFLEGVGHVREFFDELIAGGAQAPTEQIVAEGLEAAKPFIARLCEAQKSLAEAAAKLGLDPASLGSIFDAALHDMADGFASVFIVATVLVGCCLVPAFFLPRKPAETPIDPTAFAGH